MPPQALIAKIGMQKVKEATVEQIVDVGLTQSGVGQKIQTVGDARLPEDLEVVAKRYKVGEGLEFTVEVDVMPAGAAGGGWVQGAESGGGEGSVQPGRV